LKTKAGSPGNVISAGEIKLTGNYDAEKIRGTTDYFLEKSRVEFIINQG